MSYAAVQNSGFTDTNLVGRVLGDTEGRAAVEEVLQQQKVRGRGLLEDNRHLVAALRDALLERHELIGTEITDVLEQAQREHGARQTRSIGSSARRPLRSSTCVTQYSRRRPPARKTRKSPRSNLPDSLPR